MGPGGYTYNKKRMPAYVAGILVQILAREAYWIGVVPAAVPRGSKKIVPAPVVLKPR